MAKNVVAVLDDAGNIKYSKAKSKNKIDGIIAMLMGLHGAIQEQPQKINYSGLMDDYLKIMGF